MNIYALICTRSAKLNHTTQRLCEFYIDCGIETKLLVNQSSIFKGYKRGFNACSPNKDDIIILCHDDIIIEQTPKEFISLLKNELTSNNTGFVGPAGTTELGPTAVWWDKDIWKQGKHRGKVYHINSDGGMYPTDYGLPGSVVCLDGLFLAARAGVIDDVGLDKPDHFEGDWDFYDIHYTTTAMSHGYTNKVVPMRIVHESSGELVGRDSWHKNRLAFIANVDLPMVLPTKAQVDY